MCHCISIYKLLSLNSRQKQHKLIEVPLKTGSPGILLSGLPSPQQETDRRANGGGGL